MTADIRIIKHELLRSNCGSFEVQFSDGRESRYFYWDDVADISLIVFQPEHIVETATRLGRERRRGMEKGQALTGALVLRQVMRG